MPYPFQIVQSNTKVNMVFEFANTERTIHLNKMEPYPNTGYMGYSVGRWEGDTLVVDSSQFTDATWFDRAGNFHSDALKVVERFTPMGRDAIRYEATIEDPQVFTRPWKIQHAALPAPGAERAAAGLPLRLDGRGDDVRAPAQGAARQALGGFDDERGRHQEDSAWRSGPRALYFGQSAGKIGF